MLDWPAAIFDTIKPIVIGACGLGFKALFRTDVKWWEIAIDALVFLPLAIFLVAPAVADWFDLGRHAEMVVVFLMGAYGRDLAHLSYQALVIFGADPTQIWRRK